MAEARSISVCISGSQDDAKHTNLKHQNHEKAYLSVDLWIFHRFALKPSLLSCLAHEYEAIRFSLTLCRWGIPRRWKMRKNIEHSNLHSCVCASAANIELEWAVIWLALTASPAGLVGKLFSSGFLIQKTELTPLDLRHLLPRNRRSFPSRLHLIERSTCSEPAASHQ